MSGRLAGKRALVFGAGSRGKGWGNGKAAAVAYAREGARVFCVDINDAAAEETQALILREGNEAFCCTADATESRDVARAVAACVQTLGGIDILHNNVGAPAPGDPVEMAEEVWHANLAVNISTAFLTCKYALPVLAEDGGGAVVNIASIAGIRNLERSLVGYQAGKAALLQLSRSIAAQWGPRNVRSNCILPGLMLTPLVLDRIVNAYPDETARARALAERCHMVPAGYMGDAWDTAWASVYLASDEAKYVSGADLVVDGGLTAGRALEWRALAEASEPVAVPDAETRSLPCGDSRLAGKVALVFGAGSRGPGWGNGKAAAVLLARAGAKVLAVDLNREAAEETRAVIESEGGSCSAIAADATAAADVENAVNECLQRFGSLDILLNNVGAAARGSPVDIEEAAWDANIALNTKPAFLACKYAIPVMERQGGGSIIHTASISGLSVPEHGLISYQTGKAGLLQFSRGVGHHYARAGIRSNCIVPGKIRTPMTDDTTARHNGAGSVQRIYDQRAASVPLRRMGEGWDVGWAAVYLGSDEARYVNCAQIVVDGGLITSCC